MSQQPPPSQGTATATGTSIPCAPVAALARHLSVPLPAGTDPTGASTGTGSSCCSWPGISCTPDNVNVKSIAWPRQSLQGNLSTLPPLVDSSSSSSSTLELLDLAGNPLIVGSIPPHGALSHLTTLRSLSLASTGISGAIPPNSLPPNLIALDLSSTSLSGPLPPLPKSISACTLASTTANYTCAPPLTSFPSACRSSLPAALPDCPTPGPFDNFQWTSDVIILISASIVVTLALVAMIVVCYRWDRARDVAALEKDQLLGELRRIRVQQAGALGVDPALEALGPQIARAAMKRSSMASSSAEGSAPTTPSTPGAPDPRVSYVGGEQHGGGVRTSYDPYDPRWSYPSTPGTPSQYDPHAPPPSEQRALYMSSYPAAASPSTALWPPHSDATPSPNAPAAAGGVRLSWPVYPPAPSSSASAASSSPAPLVPVQSTVPPISHPPPVTNDLAATPATHPHVPRVPPNKRHSLLSVFRTALAATKWTRRRSAPPTTTPVLVTTEPLKSHESNDYDDHDSSSPARPESWIGGRSLLPPSVIEYRALDTLEHAQEGDLGEVWVDPAAPAASLVAQYPRSEADVAPSRFVSPPASMNVLGAGDSSVRWLPSADHRMSVSAEASDADVGLVLTGMPARHNSAESIPQLHTQIKW